MKKIGLGQSLEILAHAGVLTGIIFLVIEINQNTAMIEAEMTQSRTESAMSEAQSLYNSDYLPEIFIAIRKGDPLTDVQIERARHWFRGFNRNLDNQLRQYQRGLLSDDILRSVDTAVRNNAEAPIFREMWESTRLTFTDEYISFVDKIMAEIAETEAEAPG